VAPRSDTRTHMQDLMVVRTLVIETSETHAGILKGMLDADPAAAYDTEHTSSLAAAVHAAADSSFDVCLMDLTVDGAGTASIGRLRSADPKLPIVALTSVRHAHLQEGVLRAGAQEVLVKGRFTREVLHRAVHNAVDRQRLMNHLVSAQQLLMERNDELLGKVTHDLRNPLAAILGAIEILQQDTAELDEQQMYLVDVISRNGARMLELLESLRRKTSGTAPVGGGGAWVTGDEAARWIAEGVVTASQVEAGVRRARVLCADDSNVNLKVAQAFLEHLGCVTTTVQSGEDVIARSTGDCEFDVLLLDLHMDGIGGIEVAERLRAHSDPNWSGTPIVAVTATVNPKVLKECSDAGMSGNLPKPFTLEQLRNVLFCVLEEPPVGVDVCAGDPGVPAVACPRPASAH